MSIIPTPVIRLILGYLSKFISKFVNKDTLFETLEWYREIMLLDINVYSKRRIFYKACEVGNLPLAKQLCEELNISREDALGVSYRRIE